MSFITQFVKRNAPNNRIEAASYKHFLFHFLIVLISSFFTIYSYAQIPSQCGSPGCTSNDVRIVKAYIADASVPGNYFVCSNNDLITGAYLHLVVTTSTKRIGVFISATLNIVVGTDTAKVPIANCFSSALNGSNIELTPVALPNSDALRCGNKFFLTQVFTAWGTGTTDFCQGSTAVQCPSTPSKCRFVPGEVIFVQTQPCDVPTSVVASANNNPICQGGNTTFTVTYSNGQSPTFQWESSPDGITWTPISGATSTTLSLTSVPLSTNGTRYHCVVTNNTSDPLGTHTCPQASNAVTLTVNQTSSAGSLSGTQSVCSGNQPSTSLTLSGIVGNVVRWEKSTSSTFSTITTIAKTTTSLTGSDIGVLTVDTWFRAVVQNGACAEAVSATPVKISIYTTPVINNSSTATLCSGSATSINLSATVASSFSWTLGTNTGNISGASAGSGSTIAQTLTNPNNTAGSIVYNVSASSTDGSCPSAPLAITVTVNPKPAIAAKTATICSGTAFTVTPVNGGTEIVPSGTTYTWGAPVSSPVGAVTGGSAQASGVSSISQTLTNTTNAPATLTYTVTPTGGSSVGSCTGTAFTVTVTVNPKPNIAGKTQTICSGTSFSVAPVNGTDIVPAGTTYTWGTPVSSPSGAITGGSAQATGVSSISQTLNNTTNTAATLTYTVTPTGGSDIGSCGGSSFTVTITVNPKPSIANKTASICSGGTFLVSPSNGTDVVPAGTTYSWGTPTVTGGVTGGSAQTGQSSISQSLTNPGNTTDQTATYTVTPSAGTCSGSSFSVTVTVKFIPPAPTVGVVNNCDGSSDLTASNYTGTLLWSNAATTSTIHVLSAGTYTVTQTVNGCTSLSGSNTAAPKFTPGKPVIVVTQPSLCGPAKGSIQVCNPDSRFTYSIGATSLPGSGGSVVFTDLVAGSNPTVVATYQGCTSAAATCSDNAGTCGTVTQASDAGSETQKATVNKAGSIIKGIGLSESGLSVRAFPNPFTNKVSFVVASATSGYGSLDVYNVLGQKVRTVYQGMISSGEQVFSLDLPGRKASALIYRLHLNGKTVSGKIIQLQQ